MRKTSSVSRNTRLPSDARQGASTGAVRSVSRALDLLDAVVRSEGSSGVSELAASSGLPVGTVHRLLGALAVKGFVRHDPEARRYSVGHAALELAGRIRQRNGLPEHAEPYLRELVELTGESANLAILDGQAAMYVAHVASSRTVRMFTEAGNRAPLHASGTGKVLLASLPDERRDVLLDRLALERHTAQTITDPGELLRELDRVRRSDVALDNGEFEEGVSCIAVPVRDASGGVVAAISVSGPASRLTRARAESLAPRIREVAADLSRALGWRPAG